VQASAQFSLDAQQRAHCVLELSPADMAGHMRLAGNVQLTPPSLATFHRKATQAPQHRSRQGSSRQAAAELAPPEGSSSSSSSIQGGEGSGSVDADESQPEGRHDGAIQASAAPLYPVSGNATSGTAFSDAAGCDAPVPHAATNQDVGEQQGRAGQFESETHGLSHESPAEEKPVPEQQLTDHRLPARGHKLAAGNAMHQQQQQQQAAGKLGPVKAQEGGIMVRSRGLAYVQSHGQCSVRQG